MMLKKINLKSGILIVFTCVTCIFMIRQKNIVPEETKAADVSWQAAEYLDEIPFVTIGPDWGEDTIVLEKLFQEQKEKRERNLQVPEEERGEYDNLAFANVDDYVNVRSLPTTEGDIIGRIYDGSVAEILEVAGENGEWYKITSGNVNGYIKAEYFFRGEEAAHIMDQYIIRYARVKADYLNVRKEATTDSERLGVIARDEKVRILENQGEWIQIQYTENEVGFVASDYITVTEEFLYAQTLEEIEEKERQKREEQQRRKKLEDNVSKSLEEVVGLEENVMNEETETSLTEVSVPAAEDVRNQIISYAMQYQGNRYVPGGGTLAGGTDCSGFTCFIYADFGYSISRTPQGQYTSAGSSISYEEAQPGDIICYSSNGGKSCTHVGIYIGDGQIIHSANSRKGVIVQNADYDMIIGVRSVIGN